MRLGWLAETICSAYPGESGRECRIRLKYRPLFALMALPLPSSANHWLPEGEGRLIGCWKMTQTSLSNRVSVLGSVKSSYWMLKFVCFVLTHCCVTHLTWHRDKCHKMGGGVKKFGSLDDKWYILSSSTLEHFRIKGTNAQLDPIDCKSTWAASENSSKCLVLMFFILAL